MDKKVTADIKSASLGENKLDTLKKKKGGFFRWLIVLIIVVLIILAGLYAVSRVTNWNVLGIDKTGVSGKWQAVFLSNGQVYFGQTSRENSDMVILKDIYYLQVTRALQPATEGQTEQQELSLVKLGNELHGPEDQMRINHDHILFIEDLKEDGKVVRAIQRYVETQESGETTK